MRKVLIFGNSGSGKSTLARRLSAEEGMAHLDLDVLAWLPTEPPERRPLSESRADIDRFIAQHDSWVIEGCYTDLLELAAAESSEMIFMNLPVAVCRENARNRPWEPHKYDSKAAQDANLEMLIDWISHYPDRSGTFSESAHRQLFANYTGKKTLITSNPPENSLLSR